MESILKALPQMGITSAVMAIVFVVVMLLYKFIDKMPNKKDEEKSNFYRELTSCIAAHNERAIASHQTILDNFKIVMKDHEKFSEMLTGVLQILCVQNQQMAAYDRGLEKVQERLQEICKNVEK